MNGGMSASLKTSSARMRPCCFRKMNHLQLPVALAELITILKASSILIIPISIPPDSNRFVLKLSIISHQDRKISILHPGY
ncbi:MAG: hypothetical protein MZV64_35735 [Ignavibacteriales bacterium]|nr:hypothetical protein [Ignavibacteriales bacterium]